jgi:hypothetical protein
MTHTTLSKPAQTNKQIQEYLSAVNEGMKGRFVVPSGKGWCVRKPNNPEGLLFTTKTEAIAKAKQELEHTKGELFIFDQDSRLTDRQKFD